MPSPYVEVQYRYCKIGSSAWTSSSWSGPMLQKSETLVMQKLREHHKGYQVELKSIKWRP
jgi:hypothetical protein